MKILFLGSLFLDSEEIELMQKSRVGLQNSIVKFQRSFIQGIQDNVGEKIEVLSMIPVGTYPKNYSELFVKGKKQNSNIKISNLGFINLPVLKQLIISYKMKRNILKWIKKNRGENRCIIMYDLLLPHLLALTKVKNKYPDIITCSIVADLPNEFGYKKQHNNLTKRIKTQLGNLQLKKIQELDIYVLLTKQMKNPLCITEENYVVIEGLTNITRSYLNEFNDNNGKRIVLYSGELNKEYGLEILVKSFLDIKSMEYELWFCGKGEYKNEIINTSKIDSRVKYFGYLSLDEVRQLQINATLLINPRQNIGEYTRYSFPSKIIEYLSIGKPVLAYKLDGMPEEYNEFIFSPENNSAESLKNKIIEVCSLPLEKRIAIGSNNYEFIKKYKNPEMQTKKLIDLIKSKLNSKVQEH